MAKTGSADSVLSIVIIGFGALFVALGVGAAHALLDFFGPRDENFLTRWIVSVAVGVGFAALFYFLWHAWISGARKHEASCAELSHAMGGTFKVAVLLEELAARTGLSATDLYHLYPDPKFLRGHQPYCSNAMETAVNGVAFLLVDLHQEPTRYRTVIFFPRFLGPRSSPTEFVLRPRSMVDHFFDSLSRRFGMKKTAVCSPNDEALATTFMKNYVLESQLEDEKKLHQWFGDKVCAFFAKNPGWTVKVRKRCLIVTRFSGQQCPAASRRALLEEALGIFRVLTAGKAH